MHGRAATLSCAAQHPYQLLKRFGVALEQIDILRIRRGHVAFSLRGRNIHEIGGQPHTGQAHDKVMCRKAVRLENGLQPRNLLHQPTCWSSDMP